MNKNKNTFYEKDKLNLIILIYLMLLTKICLLLYKNSQRYISIHTYLIKIYNFYKHKFKNGILTLLQEKIPFQ